MDRGEGIGGAKGVTELHDVGQRAQWSERE